MDRWNGKVAVVTGASSGIGAAIVEKFVEAGMQVVGLARRVERVEEQAKSLSNLPGKLYAYKADVTIEDDIINAFQWTTTTLGPIHILVNNAGIVHITNKLMDGDTAKWKQLMDTNVLGLCIATREAIQNMIANSVNGHIVHINSVCGHYSHIGANMYGASKFAITNLTETLRRELVEAKSEIKITSVSPGLVDTEMFTDHAGFTEDEKLVLKTLQSEDIANAVLYAVGTPPHVQIHDIIIKPIGELF